MPLQASDHPTNFVSTLSETSGFLPQSSRGIGSCYGMLRYAILLRHCGGIRPAHRALYHETPESLIAGPEVFELASASDQAGSTDRTRSRQRYDLAAAAHSSSESSSESSSSSSSSSVFTGAAGFLLFFFFGFFFFLSPTGFDSGNSRILRTSSSVIFLSLLTFSRSGDGGAANFCRPFFVIA